MLSEKNYSEYERGENQQILTRELKSAICLQPLSEPLRLNGVTYILIQSKDKFHILGGDDGTFFLVIERKKSPSYPYSKITGIAGFQRDSLAEAIHLMENFYPPVKVLEPSIKPVRSEPKVERKRLSKYSNTELEHSDGRRHLVGLSVQHSANELDVDEFILLQLLKNKRKTNVAGWSVAGNPLPAGNVLQTDFEGTILHHSDGRTLRINSSILELSKQMEINSSRLYRLLRSESMTNVDGWSVEGNPLPNHLKSLIASKVYSGRVVIDPQGNEHILESNPADFARLHGLIPSNFYRVLKGKSFSAQGWRAKPLENV
jgi:hypothetical protein